jgi:hypothetical protein
MTLEPFFDDIINDAAIPVARASSRPLLALMEDRYEYPNRTAFVAADSPIFGLSFAQAAFRRASSGLDRDARWRGVPLRARSWLGREHPEAVAG